LQVSMIRAMTGSEFSRASAKRHLQRKGALKL